MIQIGTHKGEFIMRFGAKILIAAGIALAFACSNNALAQQYEGSGPQMFANQYTQGFSNEATAQMYVAPVPVPPWVGHTYYTYPPLYPHEMMYRHSSRYHSYYDGGRGLNRTSVHYYAPPVRTALSGFANGFSLPRP